MKRFKKIWLPIILAVTSGILINWLTPVNIPGAIRKAILWLVHFFLIKVHLPVWGIILLMLIIPFLIILIILFKFYNKSVENYTLDTFFEVLWEWDYVGGKICDEGIKARCPRCKIILNMVGEKDFTSDTVKYFTGLTCPHCKFYKRINLSFTALHERVIKEADRKIFTGEYKKTFKK